MDLTAEEQQTLDYYEQHALDWVKGRVYDDFWAAEAAEFQKLLPAGRVIEIGCGVGYEADLLTKLGFDYVGTDIAKAFVNDAKRRFPKLEFVQASAYDLPVNDNEFDGFWTVATLLHVPKEKMAKALSEIKRVTKPGGYGFIAIKGGDGTKIDERGRFFVYYQPDEFESVLQQVGLRVVKTDRREADSNIWLEYWVQLEA